jgi:hypothetical protein
MIARLAIIGLAVCSGSRGGALSAATPKALDALDELGASTDYRDAEDLDIIAVCDEIDAGRIRCIDAQWDDAVEPLLGRLSKLARRTVMQA